jgi:hypothetical protein
MIRFALSCPEGHKFDSWFANGAEYDRLRGAGHLACAVCGCPDVAKDLMAPRVSTRKTPAADAAAAAAPAGRAERGPLSGPASPAEQALAELRRRIEATAENVGRDFPAEARRIHAGEAPDRPIIGEARIADARALVEEGVPVAPLPWLGPRKTN